MPLAMPQQSITIEAPPVPLEDVGGSVASPQAGDDPYHHRVDRGDVPADDDADQDHGKGGEIAEAT